MIPIYVLIASLSVTTVTAISIAFIWRRVARELSAQCETAEKAYSELTAQSAIRERALMGERDHFRSAALVRQQHWVRLESAEADADRLAVVVLQYIKDMDDTAELLKDANPPALTAEREAIRLHQELLNSRANEPTN